MREAAVHRDFKTHVQEGQSQSLPFAGIAKAGFSKPSENFMKIDIDLVTELEMNKASINVFRVDGDHLQTIHAPDGSLLICNSEQAPVSQDLLIVELNGELIVRTYVPTAGGKALYSNNPYDTPIYIRKGDVYHVMGVVTQIIFSTRRRSRSIPGRVVKLKIDLTTFLNIHKPSVFVVRVEGNSMTGAHILNNCYLLVDKAFKKIHNDIVVAWINDGFTVKRFSITPHGAMLVPENAEYSPIPIVLEPKEKDPIWGIVAHVIINRQQIQQNGRA